jgi:hypothetical protein
MAGFCPLTKNKNLNDPFLKKLPPDAFNPSQNAII